MKNNIFQKMLAAMFVVGALLAVTPASAGRIDRDWRPEGALDTSADSAFNRIMTRPWIRVFGSYVKNNWGFWSINQQAQIVQRMLEQGLIAPSQAEEQNWIDLPRGPEVTIGG